MKTNDIVVGRALALGLIALRAQYENGISHGKEAGAREQWLQFGRKLLEWARDQGVERFLSGEERKLHAKELGAWTTSDIAERFWRIESLKAIFWCIRVLNAMPTYAEVGAVQDTYSRLPIGQDITGFLSGANLRDQAEVEREHQFARFLNWRCRTELFRLRGMRPPHGDSYEKVVARALSGIEENAFPIQHDGVDILINGVRFIDLGERKGNMMSICYERHLALDWVLNESGWDEAHADT